MNDMILILNYSDEFAVEAARRLRGEQVFCKIISSMTTAAQCAGRAARHCALRRAPKRRGRVRRGNSETGHSRAGAGPCRAYAHHSDGRRMRGTAISHRKASVQYAECRLFSGVEAGERYIQEAMTLMLPADVQVTAGAGAAAPIAFADDRRSLFWHSI